MAVILVVPVAVSVQRTLSHRDFPTHSDVKQKDVGVIERVDTTKISDKSKITNQFNGSNL